MPITIGPFANVPAPGDPITSPWAQQITQHVDDMKNAISYTPTLTNVVLGTGGAQACIAVVVGGPNLNDHCELYISNTITLGSAGFSVTGTPRMTLPPGFRVRGGWGCPVPGTVRLSDASAGVVNVGHPIIHNDTQISWSVIAADQTYARVVGITAAIPFTWAAGDSMEIGVAIGVQRIASLADRLEDRDRVEPLPAPEGEPR